MESIQLARFAFGNPGMFTEPDYEDEEFDDDEDFDDMEVEPEYAWGDPAFGRRLKNVFGAGARAVRGRPARARRGGRPRRRRGHRGRRRAPPVRRSRPRGVVLSNKTVEMLITLLLVKSAGH
jgi:hypothetical protein